MQRLVVFFFLAAVAVAGEKAPSTTEAAERVIAAAKSKDAATLTALVRLEYPDPWLVADLLCAQGAFDAAEAFAKAASYPDIETLPAYVAARRGSKDNALVRKAVSEVNKALGARKFKTALQAAKAAEVIASIGDDVMSARVVHGRAIALTSLGRAEESSAVFLAGAKIAERIGWVRRRGYLLRQSAICWFKKAQWERCVEPLTLDLAIQDRRKEPYDLATACLNLGKLHLRLGRFRRALELLARALPLTEALGDIGFQAEIHEDMTVAYLALGEYPKARTHVEQSLKCWRQLGQPRRIARGLQNMGVIYKAIGEYASALEYAERAVELGTRSGALDVVARATGYIADVHFQLGAFEKARIYQEKCLRLSQAVKDSEGIVKSLGNLGLIHLRLGDSERALSYFKRALELGRKMAGGGFTGMALFNIGRAYSIVGDADQALDHVRQALAIAHKIQDQALEGKCVAMLAVLAGDRNEFDKARQYARRSLDLAVRSGSVEDELQAIYILAHLEGVTGHYAEAMKLVRRAIRQLPILVGRLADEEGAIAGHEWADLTRIGARAATKTGDVGALWEFIESGRAGALLESLGNRELLTENSIPDDLGKRCATARMAAATAKRDLDRALASGDDAAAGRARQTLEASREELLRTVAAIQRAAKSAANVAYPKAAPLKRVQAGLASDESLVLYADLISDSVALVVTAKSARIAPLGAIKEIEAALDAMPRFDADTAIGSSTTLLHRLLIQPLNLSRSTKRILVSPHKRMAYVPFALLVPGHDVAFVPSGTTHDVLRSQGAQRGSGVLALGDPDYGKRVDPKLLTLLRGGGQLRRLPGTRAEARAVGDLVLLGAEATEAKLRKSLASRQRWRAVHLACHGLLNPERPLLSSLALCPDGEDDGFLATLEVFQWRIPADLVVLSACETGKGKVYAAEGIVGFTRAFMFAGAPRVIVSLWKVDDEATRALMVKFYELWNPKDGKTEPLPTATALRKAQEFVASHEQWKHPHYWAAWQLWGLPD